MFAKAVELDPAYARAYAGIADCDSFLFLHYSAPIEIKGIFETSAKALALESGLAEAHASQALALSLEQRYEEAMTEFEKAIALDPNSFEGHYFYARACFAKVSLSERRRFSSARQKSSPMIINRLLTRDRFIVPRPRRRGGECRPKGIERAERSSNFTRKTQAGLPRRQALVELGETDRAKEWLARPW